MRPAQGPLPGLEGAVRIGRRAAISEKDIPAFRRPGSFPRALYTIIPADNVLLDVYIVGEPRPKQRHRTSLATYDEETGTVRQGHAYTPKQTKQATDGLRWIFLAARRHRQLVGGPVGVGMFIQSRRREPDVDNVEKLVLDALTGSVLTDDHQVTETHNFTLRGCTEAGIDLLVWTTERRTPRQDDQENHETR